jgi:uncharacterized alpha-E superfamily protein
MSLLSSAAGTLFRFGSELEETEHLARILRVHVEVSLDVGGASADRFWGEFMDLARWPAGPPVHASDAIGLALGGDEGPSLAESVKAMRRAAQVIRPRLPTEVYEQVNGLWWLSREGPADGQLQDYLKQVEQITQLIGGLVEDTMTHDDGWNLIRLSRLFTRAVNVTRLVSRMADEQVLHRESAVAWSGVLRCCTAFEAFRLSVSEQVGRDAVIFFLLLDRASPRSARFCLEAVREAARRVDHGRADRELETLLSLLVDTDRAEVLRQPKQFGARFADLSERVKVALGDAYFRPLGSAQQVAEGGIRVQDQQQQQERPA